VLFKDQTKNATLGPRVFASGGREILARDIFVVHGSEYLLCHAPGRSTGAGALFVCARDRSAASSTAQVPWNVTIEAACRCETVPTMSESSNPQPALGAAIRKLRGARKATQETVAQDAGITVAHLSKIERGQTNPTWGTVKGIAAALSVTMSKLAQLDEASAKAG
jgi:DNA-binding XRE family transcriptional regulator